MYIFADKKTREGLVKAAQWELGIEHEFNISQYSTLIQIHQIYIDWNEPNSVYSRPPVFLPKYTDADLKKAKIAIKNFKIALRDCGGVGESIALTTVKSLGSALEWIRGLNEAKATGGIEFYPGLGLRYSPPPKRGNPGNQRLREHIIHMTGWYMFLLLKDKPGYGTDSIFPGLISASLAVVDDDWKDKNPPYKAIKNALKLLKKPLLTGQFRENWIRWHS